MHWETRALRACLVLFVISLDMPDSVQGMTMVTRPGTSNEDCSALCLQEREIDCRYYKYNSAKENCMLATEKDDTIHGLRKAEKPDPAPVKKPASSWLEQLQSRLIALEQRNIDTKNMRKDISDLRSEVAALKNSRALTHHLLRSTKEQMEQNIAAVDEKAEVIKAQSKRVEDAVMTLGELQKTFGTKIRKVNEASRATDLTVAMVSQSSKDMRASIRELANTITEIKTTLRGVRKSVTDLQVRFAGLSTDVMEKVASVDSLIGPDLKELRDSQTTLAEALSMLTKKIMALTPRIPALQRKLSEKQGLLSMMDRKIKGYGRQIAFMNERLGFSEQQLRKVIDPTSKMNTERRQMIIQLRSQVSSLLDSQNRLQNDVLVEISDKTRLFKELSALKVGRKAIIDKLMNLETAIQHFRSTMRQLATQGANGKLMSNVLSRQVAALRSLKRLRDTQAEVKNMLKDYKLHLMQTNRMLLTKDHKRMMNELALRKLQSKLINVYRKLRWSLAHSAETRQVAQLIQQHKNALIRITKMQQLQMAMQRDLGTYKTGIIYARKMLANQQRLYSHQMEQMDSLRRRTLQMYYDMSTKLSRLSSVDTKNAIERMAQLAKTQAAVLNTLETYRLSLVKTQQAVRFQKQRQLEDNRNTNALRLELQKLHRTLLLLLGDKLPAYFSRDRLADEVQNNAHLNLEKAHMNTLKGLARVHRKMRKYDELLTTLKTDPYWKPTNKKHWQDLMKMSYLNDQMEGYHDKLSYIRNHMLWSTVQDPYDYSFTHPRMVDDMVADAAQRNWEDKYHSAMASRQNSLLNQDGRLHQLLTYPPYNHPESLPPSSAFLPDPSGLHQIMAGHRPDPYGLNKILAEQQPDPYGLNKILAGHHGHSKKKRGKTKNNQAGGMSEKMLAWQYPGTMEYPGMQLTHIHRRFFHPYEDFANLPKQPSAPWDLLHNNPMDLIRMRRLQHDQNMAMAGHLQDNILNYHRQLHDLKTNPLWMYTKDSDLMLHPMVAYELGHNKLMEAEKLQRAHVGHVVDDLRAAALKHWDRGDDLRNLPSWQALQNTDRETAAELHDVLDQLNHHRKKLDQIKDAFKDSAELSQLQDGVQSLLDHENKLDKLQSHMNQLHEDEAT